MSRIVLLRPQLKDPRHLRIDVVLTVLSGSRHLSRLTYGPNGLYETPQTHRGPDPSVDIHTSYHPSGIKHQKLTRGEAFEIAGDKARLIGQAHYKGREDPREKEEVKLWESAGRPWNSLMGVEELSTPECFLDIGTLGVGYPPFKPTDADYTFQIDRSLLPSVSISLKYFLIESGNIGALERRLEEITAAWNSDALYASLNPNEILTLERALVFESLTPHLNISLFCRRAVAGGSTPQSA